MRSFSYFRGRPNRKPVGSSIAVLSLGGALILLSSACSDSEVKTYRVAKEDNTQKVPAAHTAEDGHNHGHGGGMQTSAPAPNISWTLPAGWKELQPDGMRKASFQITGEGGRMAQVMVIPLPGASNIELESVNMWREELGLSPLTKEQVTAQGQSVDLGDSKGHLFEMVADDVKPEQKFKTRTVGVVGERENVLWFIKMSGADELVAQQKPAFANFLKSLRFEAGAPAEMAASRIPASANAKSMPAEADAPNWKVPANWQQKAPGPMVTTAYGVSSPEGMADVTVIKLPGTAGGLVGNVNRWRGQVGLPPLADAEAQKSAEMLEVDGKKDAYMIDVKGTNVRSGKAARMVAVGVPRGGETWFYKLLGDDPVVSKEKDAFLKFVVSAY